MTCQQLLDLTQYGTRPGGPPKCSVPVTALVLTKDEELNIERCLTSLSWCEQVVVIDSGSTDRTVGLARSTGVTVLEHEWLGYAVQRQWALTHKAVRHDWVYFVDADEWISIPLAAEIARALECPRVAAFTQRCRVIFLGQWIRHCGWYSGFRLVRLMDRRHATWDAGRQFGERASVQGDMEPLINDLVDEDQKGVVAWMRKHVTYASLEADRRLAAAEKRPALTRVQRRPASMPWTRAVAKEMLLPNAPFKPVVLFIYMFFIRAGWRDGRRGLMFCTLHAWHEYNVDLIMRTRRKGWSET